MKRKSQSHALEVSKISLGIVVKSQLIPALNDSLIVSIHHFSLLYFKSNGTFKCFYMEKFNGNAVLYASEPMYIKQSRKFSAAKSEALQDLMLMKS